MRLLIAFMMEALRTSEPLKRRAYFNEITRRCIPEGYLLGAIHFSNYFKIMFPSSRAMHRKKNCLRYKDRKPETTCTVSD
jgi:hypothetical protein